MERKRHKETNTFKFIPFSERISNINVDVFHRVPHKFEESEEEYKSYLHQAVQKWMVLNLTENWIAFRKAIGPGIVTLPQVLNEKERIFGLFLKHISLQNVLSLQPFLELLVAFVKDIRHEFYPYFEAIFKSLVELLKSKDSDVVEWTFQCLAYIFKYLSRDLVKDLDKVLLLLTPLLNENNTQYVRDFAAQSFSFVARKVKEKKKFLTLVLHTVQNSPEILKGCSQLIFETMRGIKGQLHSSAEDMLFSMFNLMSEEGIPKKLLFSVITLVISSYVKIIPSQHSDICRIICVTLKEKSDSQEWHTVTQLLKILQITLKEKSGAHLKDSKTLIDVLIQLFSVRVPESKFTKHALTVTSTLLLSSNVKLPQVLVSRLLIKAMQTEDIEPLLEFTEALVHHSSFETTILPRALQIFESLRVTDYLTILTKIVVQKTCSDLRFQADQKYVLKSDAIYNQMEELIGSKNLIEEFESVVCALIIIRQFEITDEESVVSKINTIIETALKELKKAESIEKCLLLLCASMQTITPFADAHKRKKKDIDDEEIVITLKNILSKEKNILALRCIDIFVAMNENLSISSSTIDELHLAIQDWLCSPYSNERTLGLHILQNVMKLKTETAMVQVLQSSLDAESVPLTITDYRTKVKFLEKLNFQSLNFLEKEYLNIPLKYLLGVLYCNFQLLWDPVEEIIASFATGMPFTSFWDIFFHHLEVVTQLCKLPPKKDQYPLKLNNEFIFDVIGFVKTDEKADYANCRYLLWKVMCRFTEECESKNKDIVTLYLKFLREELLKSDSKHRLTINIKRKDTESVEDDKGEEEEEEEDTNSLKEVHQSSAILSKWASIQLELLSKFKNPKSCFREAEVRASYLDLLTHRNVEIQKKALNCLLSYKFKYVSPYKERLQNLIDDNHFKDEIVHFQIDKDTGMVEESHRSELMPIVLRIFYSQLFSKSSTQRGNKGSAIILKRSMVMKFLAGCLHSEMEIFLQMAFNLVNVEIAENSGTLIQAMTSVDLERVPPPKKLQNVINLVELILQHIGGLMSDDLQRFILRVLLSVGALTTGICMKRDEVYVGYLKALRNLRTSILECITTFFDRYKKFPWTEDEFEAIFQVSVWPTLKELPVEGSFSPTALLRLFNVWSKDPRYFALLAKYDLADNTMTPLPFIMKLLLNEKTQHSVISYITSMLEKLVTLGGDEEMETDDLPALTVPHVLVVDETAVEKLSLKEELNYGSKILLPHVGSILTFLRRQLEKSKNRGLTSDELVVLSRVTEVASSAEHGDSLMGLLLRLLSSRKAQQDEDKLLNMMNTIYNLTNIVSNPAGYIRPFAVLFDTIELLQARKILIDTLLNMASRCEELKETADIVRDLNAWNVRWIQQPDFNKRLDAFKQIRILAKDDKIPLSLASIILYNCYFFIRCEPDLSLRDSSSYCLREVCPLICRNSKMKPSEVNYIIEVLLKLIKVGIVSKDENLHVSSIQLLGVMARECADLHPVLKDLSTLSCKSDLEVDFFENATHLQIHRRMKALQRFCSIAKTYTKAPRVRTLIQFILPMATRFLCCEPHSGKHTLIDAAVQCLKTVCRLLPWHQYHTILKYYLNKLSTKIEYQKQLVKIVIAILDAFHFDTSKASTKELQSIGNKEETVDNPPKEDDDSTNEIKDLPSDKVEVKVNEDALEEILEGEAVEEEQRTENDVLQEDQENIEIEMNEATKEPILETLTILSPSEASRVEKTISSSLIGHLKRIIGQKTKVESTHRLNKKALGPDRDEEDVLKVPIAVTLVKLLQKLPNKFLDIQLPGILLNICTFLKSRMEGVRRVTRETLQQIMLSLGTSYLPVLISEMTSLLTKGFQVHVLVFTIHNVIQSIQKLLQPGDIDANLPKLLEVCKKDLFGSTSEEKEVMQIQAQFKEARSTKSYHLLNLMAQYITKDCLTDLLLPLKEVLMESHSHKAVTKCRECLRHIVIGLSVNEFLSCGSLLEFACGIASESIPKLMPEPREPPKKRNPKEKPDCFIIPSQPKSRYGILNNPVKNNARSNAHVIVECGLQLLLILLKRDNIRAEKNLNSYLDPIVIVLSKALQSQHVKVTTLALQCLARIVKYDLPNLKTEIKSIISCLFSTLHKYGAAGLSKGDNFDLVLASFKAISVIIKDVSYHDINADQFKILLLYAEQDIYDTSRQATAFTLLKTILKRKIDMPELFSLMKKVATLSITSELTHIRLQSRQAVFQYMMDYPIGKKLAEFIGFYISQLDFDVESGRQSALEMIHTLVNYFPKKILVEQSSVFLLTLGARLINDDSPECKKMVSSVIKGMLNRLEGNERDHLFDILQVWLQQQKLTHRRLSAQLAGIFVTVEKEEFAARLPNLLPLIQSQFVGSSRPGAFVRPLTEGITENQSKDHHLFQVMQLLLKICEYCTKFLVDKAFEEYLNLFTETSQSLLCHPHEWVRLAAAQFLGFVFTRTTPSYVAKTLRGEVIDSTFWFLESSSVHQRVKSLILDHTAQLVPGIEITEEFLNQITKNLVFFARVLKDFDLNGNEDVPMKKNDFENGDENGNENENETKNDAETKPKISLLWLIRRMRRVVNMEVVQTPGSYTLRTAVINWIGAVAVCLSRDELVQILYHFIAPIVRERELVEAGNTQHPIKKLVIKVSEVIKKKVGVDEYSKEAVKLQSRQLKKRAQRKVERTQEFVTDPQKAAKRKIDRQLRKKASKKRKMEIIKGKKPGKIKRKRKMDDDIF